MLKSSLCDYSDADVAVKGTIIIPNTGTATTPNNGNKEVVFKNCAPITDCISEINNRLIDNAKDIGVVMNMYNLIEYRNICLQTSRTLDRRILSIQAQNQYLDFLVDPSFQGVNRLFVLSFGNNAHWASYKQFSANCNKRLQCYDWWKKLF